jgi:hypothetical protein
MRMVRFSIARLMGFGVIAAVGVAALKYANEVWASACFTVMLVILVLAILHAIQARGKDRAYWIGFAVAGWAYVAALFGPFGTEDVSMTPSLATGVVVDLLETVIHPEANNSRISVTFTSTPIPARATFATFSTTPLIALTPVTPSTASTAVPAPAPTALAATVVSAASSISITGTLTGSTTATASTPATGSPVIPATMPMPTFRMGSGVMTRIAYSQVAHSLSALLAGMVGGLYSAWLVGKRQRREAAETPAFVV